MRAAARLRQVVVLRDIYDLPHKSIAAELGTSEAAAKVRLQRARKRLREDLGRRMHELDLPSQRRRKVLGQKSAAADGTSCPPAAGCWYG